MEKRVMSLTGNEAAAWAVRLARAKLAFSFPMGPNAEVTETLQGFIDRGEVKDLKVIYGDNEKATTSMQIAVARLGVRSMLCINSEGLLWAAAEIHYAASSRLPQLLICPSRALEPPTTVYCDHDDFMTQRDMGWLMFYCQDAQDVFDTVLQVYKVMEQKSVMLPAIVGYDGWETSHASVKVELPPAEEVDRFLPAPAFIQAEKDYLGKDWKEICGHRRRQHGDGSPYFMELRHLQKKAEAESGKVIEEVGREYGQLFGSPHVGMLESYECRDAEVVLVTMGIVYPSAKFLVKTLRKRGIRVGCVKLRVFRPFPAEALREALQGARVVVTLERNSLAAIYAELKSCLYGQENRGGNGRAPLVMGRVVGVGGAPITLEQIGRAVEDGVGALQSGKVEKELEWFPIRPIDFDPTRDTIAE
jgi:pyruvate/2-oxoacid:ferredoxin oxidoreductase alpha subunit